MMAQSALRCSCAVLSIGARGSTAGLGVKEAFAGFVQPCFEGPRVVVSEDEAFDGEAGLLGASRREGVVVSSRTFELAVVVCNSHGIRPCL